MSRPPPLAAATVSCSVDGFKAKPRQVQSLAAAICTALGVSEHHVSVTLTNSRTIKKLNREFRQKDKATDVLSFPQMTWPRPRSVRSAAPKSSARTSVQAATKTKAAKVAALPPEPLGDVVISLPEAVKNAAAIGQGLDREVCFLLVHGILHLCGHDHEEQRDEKRMLTAQRKIMLRLDSPASPLWRGCVKVSPR